MKKMKKTCKKAKGLKIRLEKEKFLDQLKNPSKYVKPPYNPDDAEILKKIRARGRSPAKQTPSPYDAGSGGAMAKFRRFAGLE